MHIFIDTNVLLAFYAYTSDDVEQLKIISKQIEAKKLVMYIPRQVQEEHLRNREVKLAESLREFGKSINQSGIPRFISSFDGAKKFQKALKDFEVAKSELIAAARKDAEERRLAADEVLVGLIKTAQTVETTSEIIAAAQRRKFVGNPPGKKDSHGDQINWECLLSAVPDGNDLHVISKDGDFASPLTPTRPHHFLVEEWKTRKAGDLHLHEELRPFLNKSFPGIKLATDIEKITAIERLEKSNSFASTHAAMVKMHLLIDVLTWSDVDRLFIAGLDNDQIRWISTDDDVSSFYIKLINKFESQLDQPRLDKLRAMFRVEPSSL